MANDLPHGSTIDVSGLPEPVVRVVRDLVNTLRSNFGEGAPSATGRKPLAGRLAHLNLKVPTLEEFQEVRRGERASGA